MIMLARKVDPPCRSLGREREGEGGRGRRRRGGKKRQLSIYDKGRKERGEGRGGVEINAPEEIPKLLGRWSEQELNHRLPVEEIESFDGQVAQKPTTSTLFLNPATFIGDAGEGWG